MVVDVSSSMLTEKACYVRSTILEMCVSANAGHLASSLSCVEILVALYYGGILRIRPHEPNWEDRDRFIISKGHGGIGLYPILSDLGFFDKSELQTFGKDGSRLGIHPDPNAPGIEMVTGSLGHGLGVGAGLALAAKMDGKSYKTVVLLGDGECYEGSIWEAAMFAGCHKLDNLVVIIDYNIYYISYAQDSQDINLIIRQDQEKKFHPRPRPRLNFTSKNKNGTIFSWLSWLCQERDHPIIYI